MTDEVEEYQVQRRLLNTAIGAVGSGAIRYAAAMYFHTLHQISAEMLEIYRSCSKFDNEDPLAIARYEGVSLSGLPSAPGQRQE